MELLTFDCFCKFDICIKADSVFVFVCVCVCVCVGGGLETIQYLFSQKIYIFS